MTLRLTRRNVLTLTMVYIPTTSRSLVDLAHHPLRFRALPELCIVCVLRTICKVSTISHHRLVPEMYIVGLQQRYQCWISFNDRQNHLCVAYNFSIKGYLCYYMYFSSWYTPWKLFVNPPLTDYFNLRTDLPLLLGLISLNLLNYLPQVWLLVCISIVMAFLTPFHLGLIARSGMVIVVGRWVSRAWNNVLYWTGSMGFDCGPLQSFRRECGYVVGSNVPTRVVFSF